MLKYLAVVAAVLCLASPTAGALFRHEAVQRLPIQFAPPAPGCPRHYDPFCCQGPQGITQEINDCSCFHKHGFPLYPGMCYPSRAAVRAPPLALSARPFCECTTVYKPVCCTINGNKKFMGNNCFCKCIGGTSSEFNDCH